MKTFTFRLSRHDETQDTFSFDEGEDPKEALIDWVLNTVEFWSDESNMLEEIVRLRAEVAKLRATIEDMELMCVAGDERISKLEKALRPFAEIASGSCRSPTATVLRYQCDDARAALSPKETPSNRLAASIIGRSGRRARRRLEAQQ